MNPFEIKEVSNLKTNVVDTTKAFECMPKTPTINDIKKWLDSDGKPEPLIKWPKLPEPLYLNEMGALNDIQKMLSGEVNGNKTLGLNDIKKWKINENYQDQNIRQHAGFAAEIISVAKENLRAKFDNTGITTSRADDLPAEYGFKKNDQFVDKVRMDKDGNIIETIQMKFVGNTPVENLRKLMSKKYDKYFESGKVDKIEIPKDFYDDVKKLIPQEKSRLERQLDRVKADGKTDVTTGIENRIKRLDKIDKMLEKSTVRSDEARYATLHPQRYAAQLFAKDYIKAGHETGKDVGASGACITLALSTVDNFRDVVKGECTVKDAVKNIGKDTAKSGALGYSTGFISGGVARAMSQSCHELIRSASKTGIPGAAVSFVVDAYDSVVDYAKGEISGGELAKDAGRSVAGIAGSMGASAVAGAALGSFVPGAGTVVGAGVGIVASMAGYSLAAAGYNTAMELGNKGAHKLLEKCSAIAKNTVTLTEKECPHKLKEIKSAFERFNLKNNIPVNI